MEQKEAEWPLRFMESVRIRKEEQEIFHHRPTIIRSMVVLVSFIFVCLFNSQHDLLACEFSLVFGFHLKILKKGQTHKKGRVRLPHMIISYSIFFSCLFIYSFVIIIIFIVYTFSLFIGLGPRPILFLAHSILNFALSCFPFLFYFYFNYFLVFISLII